jgi:hypothetical protein
VTTSSPSLQTVTPPAALSPVFDEWRNTLAAYANAVPGDLPWWYNETAAVGFLAAAAWRTGGVAIVEFDNERTDTDSHCFRGRCDLYVKRDGAACYAEAKQTFHRLNDSGSYTDAVADVRALLDEASAQLASLQCEANAGHFALVFASPRLNVRHASHLDAWLSKWSAALRTIEDAVVYTYFDQARALAHADKQGDIYPGIALVARVVRACQS